MNKLILVTLIALFGAGCASMGVPVSVCDAQDASICRAEWAAEAQANTAVDFADDTVCLDLNFVCPDRDPDCASYCAMERGSGDVEPVTRDVPVD